MLKSCEDRYLRNKRDLYVNQDPSHKFKNSELLSDLDCKLAHLPSIKRNEIAALISEYECLLSNVPSQSTMAFQDVDVGSARLIKQLPYWTNP